MGEQTINIQKMLHMICFIMVVLFILAIFFFF